VNARLNPALTLQIDGACSETAEIPFDWILDKVTGSDPKVTNHVLEMPATSLQCGATITEKTLIDPA